MILDQKAQDLIDTLEIFRRNAIDERIGERELRKLLYESLSQAHDHYITHIISNLRDSRPPDESNFFRRFKIAEIIDVIKGIFEMDIDLDDALLRN